MSAKCRFCDAPSWTGDFFSTPMCEKHFDLALVCARIDRRGDSISIPAVAREIKSLRADTRSKLKFMHKEIPALLRSMRQRGYLYTDSTRRQRIRRDEKETQLVITKGKKNGTTRTA